MHLKKNNVFFDHTTQYFWISYASKTMERRVLYKNYLGCIYPLKQVLCSRIHDKINSPSEGETVAFASPHIHRSAVILKAIEGRS